MALVVESTSTVNGNNQSSLTINKPTGTADGDLLILVVNGYNLNPPECSGFTASIDHVYDAPGAIQDATVSLLYKVAGSSEPSTYSITNTGAATGSFGAAVMLRVSGWNTGDPVYTYDVHSTYVDSATPSVGGSGLAVQRPSGQLLIAVAHMASSLGAITSSSWSNYSITSTDANPTWTEVLDVTNNVVSSARNVTLAVAYAITTDTSDITAWGIDGAADTNGDADTYIGFLAVVCEPTATVGTTALHSVTPTEFSEAAVEVGTSGTNTLLTPEITINTHSGEGIAPTVWTTTNKS